MPSFERPTDPDIAPSPWVCRHAALIRADGEVLDLACGSGRHARWLLGQGFRVLAADIDVSRVEDLRGADRVEILQADLEVSPWPLAGRRFDGIVVANYLHRPHFGLLTAALREGGVLIIETFAAGNELLGRPRNPAFLLQPGELLDAFAGTLQIVAYQHGREYAPRPAVRQRLCAVRGEGPVDLPVS
jgi:SAM-dependent methyltransferase